MELKLLKKGIIFNIYAIVLNNGTCPAEKFLEYLRIEDQPSHKSFVNLLNRHADHGQLRNERKSKVLKDRKNLLEFKTYQGDRIMYFYLPGNKTILTHGFHKGAPEAQEYKNAELMRDSYCKEIDDDKF